MAKPQFGEGHEFPTEWHRDAYIAGLERELEGAKLRKNDEYVETVEAELKRLGKLKAPAKAKAEEPAEEEPKEEPVKGPAKK